MYKNVKIKCPQCGKAVKAKVIYKKGMPFAVYDGYCKDCDYYIMESEWEEV